MELHDRRFHQVHAEGSVVVEKVGARSGEEEEKKGRDENWNSFQKLGSFTVFVKLSKIYLEKEASRDRLVFPSK